MGGLRDTDHIEAALALNDRGVPVHLITADIGLMARARTAGVPTFHPRDQWALTAEPSPRDRETEARLRLAQLQAPPAFVLQVDLNERIGTVTLQVANSGGAAR